MQSQLTAENRSNDRIEKAVEKLDFDTQMHLVE